MSAVALELVASWECDLTVHQRRVFEAVARDEVRFNPNGIDGSSWLADVYRHVNAHTLASLVRRGLIGKPARRGGETEAAWQLTDNGKTLALHLGLIELPPSIDDSPGDLADALDLDGQRLFADEEQCSTCRVPRRRWPVDHELFSESASQCPWCIQADIDDDKRHERRLDQ